MATAQHGQRLVQIFRLRVAGDDSAAPVRLFDQVVLVVGVDTRRAGSDFLDSVSPRIVF